MKLEHNVSASSRPSRCGLGHQRSAQHAKVQQHIPTNHSCELDDSNLPSSPDHLPIKAEYLDSWHVRNLFQSITPNEDDESGMRIGAEVALDSCNVTALEVEE